MIERRMFLAGSAAAAAGLGPGGALAQPAAATSTNAGVFRHGIASGDPLPDAVLLWTRVTPTADVAAGLGRRPAGDRRLAGGQRPAASAGSSRTGRRVTGPERDHTVKVDARGLAPATAYYYRFTLDRTTSPVGRTRTAPAPTASPDRLRFGVVSCANCEAGYFSAYRHLAARDDLDAVLHLGDYVYEYGTGQYGYGKSDTVRASARARPRDARPGRLPAAARAVQDRPRPAGPARDRTRGSPPGTTTRPPTTPGPAAPRTTSQTRATGPPARPSPARPTTSGCRSGCPAPRPLGTACRSTAGCSSAGSPT